MMAVVVMMVKMNGMLFVTVTSLTSSSASFSSSHKTTTRHRLADKLRLQWNSRWLPGTLRVSLEKNCLALCLRKIIFVILSTPFADVSSIVVSFGWTPVSLTPRRIITSKVLICKQKVLFWIKGWFKQKVVVVVILQIQLNSFQAAAAEVEAVAIPRQ